MYPTRSLISGINEGDLLVRVAFFIMVKRFKLFIGLTVRKRVVAVD
jgi:hypothetical protein